MPSSMKCFKRFFKHTWHPQQMIALPSPASIWDYPYPDQITSLMSFIYEVVPDPQQEFLPSAKNRIPSAHMESPSRFETAKTVGVGFNAEDTELGEVKIVATTPGVAASNSIEVSAEGIPCGNGGCKASRSRQEPRHESPWHRLKTIFLVSVIVALIVWVIVYALLSQYQIL